MAESFPVFTFCPRVAASGQTELRNLAAQFGDGYVQRAGDGINARLTNWTLDFTGTADDILQIKEFLDEQEGFKAFEWTTPTRETQRFVTPEGYTVQTLGANVMNLSVVFVQQNRLPAVGTHDVD